MTDPTVVDLAARAGLDQRTLQRIDSNRAESTRSTANGIPARFKAAVAEHPQIVAWVQAVVAATWPEGTDTELEFARITGPSLLLVGPTGTGKTHQAYGAIRALAASGLWVPTWQAVVVGDMHDELRPIDTRTQVMDRYARAAVLLLDDLGVRDEGTEWTRDMDTRLINRRYNTQLPTIITTNLPPDRLAEQVGDRIVSRLVQMCSIVTLKGADRRMGGVR